MTQLSITQFVENTVQLVASLPGGQLLMLLAMPAAFLLAAIEWWYYRHSDKYDLKDSMASVAMGSAYILLAEGLIVGALVIPGYEWLYQFRLYTITMNPASFIGLFLLVDFFFYLFHTATHRIRFLWGVHEVHHASEHFNYTVAFRQSVVYAFVGAYMFFIPPILLGFSPAWMMLILAANLILQILVHTQAVPRLPGWIEWTFNTPSNHRVHHARNDQYIDRNMGGLLMIWDHLFGTYAAEDPHQPPEYGVVAMMGKSPGYNPVVLTFREYGDMMRDIARPGPLSHRLKHLWGPPEWQRPDDERSP